MAKYVIEIPDDRACDYVGSTHLLMPYTMAGHKGHHDTGLNLTPYTEPDRKAVENAQEEAWEFAGRLYYSEEYGGMNNKDFRSAFYGESAESVALNMSYQEVKSKYEAWMADKKQKEASELEEVTALANRIGIHRLYSLVKEIRGE